MDLVTVNKTTEIINNGKTKRITTKYNGPQSVIDRIINKRFFGSVTEANSRQSTTVGNDVYLEPPENSVPYYEPNGYYVTKAKEYGWSESAIKSIIKAESPSKVYQKLYRKHIIQPEIDKIKSTLGQHEPEKTSWKAKMASKLKNNTESSESKSLGWKARMKNKKSQFQDNEQQSTLFITNIPDDYTEEDIQNELKNRFDIRRVNVVRVDRGDGHRVSNGKAFVVCRNQQEAQSCMDYLSTCRWGSLVISVQFAKPK